MSQHDILNLREVHCKVTKYQLKYVLKILQNNEDIQSLKILGNAILHTVYADDTTVFFLKKLGSIKELLNTISLFSLFSYLKPNLYY